MIVNCNPLNCSHFIFSCPPEPYDGQCTVQVQLPVYKRWTTVGSWLLWHGCRYAWTSIHLCKKACKTKLHDRHEYHNFEGCHFSQNIMGNRKVTINIKRLKFGLWCVNGVKQKCGCIYMYIFFSFPHNFVGLFTLYNPYFWSLFYLEKLGLSFELRYFVSNAP